MTVETYKGQTYVAVGTVPHYCRDGRETTLSRWMSWCIQCSEPFMFTTPTQRSKFQPNRRCKEHRRPGQMPRGAR